MRAKAKIFTTGRSQAVRLPAAFRFDCKEVYVERNPRTGEASKVERDFRRSG
jgi:antitoxin VapB